MSLRERGKERRRQRVLDAARRIISKEGAESLRMRELAAAAELSSRTLYNLFGTKGEILAALASEVLTALAVEMGPVSGGDPIDLSRYVITRSIEVFDNEKELYRPLLAEAFTTTSGPRSSYVIAQARQLQHDAVAEAQERGLLTHDIAPDLLAHHILGAYNHAALSWSLGLYERAEFETQVLHAWASLLLGIATADTRERLQHELDTLAPRMQSMMKASAEAEELKSA